MEAFVEDIPEISVLAASSSTDNTPAALLTTAVGTSLTAGGADIPGAKGRRNSRKQ